MRRLYFILLALLFTTHTFSQTKKQRVIVDKGRRYAYSDTAGVTESYISYFGDRLVVPELTTIEGKTISAETTRGKTVVYNFWFVSCRPCVAEMPALNNIVRKYQSDSIIFVGISFDKENVIRTFLEKHSFLFQVASLPQAEITRVKKVEFYPFTAIVTRDGRLSFAIFGRPTGSRPDEEIFDLLDRQIEKALR